MTVLSKPPFSDTANTRHDAVWNGAAGILAALSDVPANYRLDAFALAVSAAIETAFMGDTRTMASFGSRVPLPKCATSQPAPSDAESSDSSRPLGPKGDV